MNALEKAGILVGMGILKGIYAVMKLMPTQNKVTMISRQSNKPSLDMKLLRDQLHKDHPGTVVVMLPRKLDNRFTYCFHMLRQMHHVATSKVVVLDSYCMVISILKHKPSLQVIQMWHALGSMKKFGYAMLDQPEGSSREVAELMHMHRGYTDVLISSMGFVKDFEEGFHITPDVVREIPLPRVDLLTDPGFRTRQRKRYFDMYPELTARKNILYCPTFRKEIESDQAAASRRAKGMKDLFDRIDYKHYNLIYRPHPLDGKMAEDPRILKIPGTTQDLLFVADCMISDYSSVIYEAGLLDLPVYLYAYDWDDYREKRQINVDLEDVVPLPFYRDAESIVRCIEMGGFDMRKFEDFVKENVKVPHDSTCCEKIVDLMRL